MFNRQRVEKLLADLGFRADAAEPEWRLDSGETAAFTRQLMWIETAIYETEYPENRARQFIPEDGSVANWAETYTWRIWNWAAMATLISRYSDDLPAVDVMAAEKIQKIESLGVSFGYSIQDLRAASRLNMPLDTEKGDLARRTIENKIENLAVFGDATSGLPGFVNMPNVPILSSPTDLTGNWLTGATPKEILADMHAMPNAVDENTKGTHKANTLLLPRRHYRHIATTTLNDFTSETIMTTFLKQSDTVRQVDQWNYLDTASNASGPLAVCYEKNPRVVKLVIPQPFEMMPPQAANLAFKIPCHARYGGVSWRYPMAAVYGVGL
jgi:hypothetical protein